MSKAELPTPPEEITPELLEDDPRLPQVIEAILLAADGPLTLDTLQKLIGGDFNAGRGPLRKALEALSERLVHSAAEVREVAGGWRLQVRSEYAAYVSRLWQEKPPKMTRAALETLALIVYRQPITRGEIEDIRGVAVSSNILRTLAERGWIQELGVKDVPGRPTLFGTAAQFLDDFGLKSLDQLPALPEIRNPEQLESALAHLAGAAEQPAPADELEPAISPDAAQTPADATLH